MRARGEFHQKALARSNRGKHHHHHHHHHHHQRQQWRSAQALQLTRHNLTQSACATFNRPAHLRQSAELLAAGHAFDQLLVRDHEGAFVGQEELEAVYAFGGGGGWGGGRGRGVER